MKLRTFMHAQRAAGSRAHPSRLQPQLEILEDRLAPSIADGTLLVATAPSPFSSNDPGFSTAAIIAIDSRTGGQIVLSAGGSLSNPSYIAEGSNQQIYVSDLTAFGTGAIFRIDPNTGQQTMVATGGFINGPNVLAFVNGMLYVADEGDATGSVHNLVQIDPNSGQQSLVTSGTGFTVPTGMVPAPGDNVYVTDEPGSYQGSSQGMLWEVNLDTGQQTLISQGGLFDHPVDVAVEPSGTLIVANTGGPTSDNSGSLIRIDPQTGTQSLVASFGPYSGINSVEVGQDGTLFVGTIADGSAPAQIVAVNPVTGAQSILSSGGDLSLVGGIRAFHAAAPTNHGGGDVLVTLNASTGLLNINGYNEDDTITVEQSSPGFLQVSGTGTLINQSSDPAGFPLRSISAIQISLLNGNDSITMDKFTIPGALSIFAGSGFDNLSLATITAGPISISIAGPGKGTISLNAITAASVTISTGDNASLFLRGISCSDFVTLSARNNAAVSLDGVAATNDLSITLGDNSQLLSVKNSSSYNMNILQTGSTGNPSFDLENDTIHDDLTLHAGDGGNGLVLSHVNVALRMFVTLGAGKNTVSADHITALFGLIDGGSSGDNAYSDGGGNNGYSVFDFIGH